VTVLPFVASRLGMAFGAAAADGAGAHFATGILRDLTLRLDINALAMLAFTIGITAFTTRMATNSMVPLCAVTFTMAGLVDAVQIVPHLGPGAPASATYATTVGATLLGRAAAGLIFAGGGCLIRFGFALGRRPSPFLLFALFLPVVAYTWHAMATILGPSPLPLSGLGSIAVLLYVLTAIFLLPVVQDERETFFGRGLIAGLVPLAVGQLALNTGVVSVYDNGFHIAMLLKWFAWLLPAVGLGIDFLSAFHVRGVTGEKQFLRAVVDAIPHFIYARDLEGRFTLVNKAVARYYDRRVDQVEGHGLADINDNPDQVRAWMDEDRETFARGTEWTYPEEVQHNTTGETLWLQSIKKPLLSNLTGQPQVLGVSIDVTDRVHIERELAQRLKLERTAAGILKIFVQCTAETLDETMAHVLADVGDFTGASRCAIVRFGAGDQPARRLFCWIDPAGDMVAHPPLALDMDLLGWSDRWFSMNTPVVVGPLETRTLATSKTDGRWQIIDTKYERIYELNEHQPKAPRFHYHYLGKYGNPPA